MQAKVRVAHASDQLVKPPAWLVLACVLLLLACGHDNRRAPLVQADTTGGSGQATEDVPPQGRSERAVMDGESLAGREDPTGVTPSARGGSAERFLAGGDARGARPIRTEGDDADDMDGAATEDSGGIEERGRRPPPPVLLPAGRILLPPETVFAVELRTPIHTATTLVGDRFAARLTQDVAAGGRVVIPAGALVEGRVTHVGSASEDGRIAFIELDARKVRLTDGRLLRITAEVLDVTGQEVLGGSAEGREAEVVPGVIGGVELSKAAREARAAILAGILERSDGRVVVAGSTDREIIIPTGTPFTLELVEPLEIPAP